jgi:hypothetical protein
MRSNVQRWLLSALAAASLAGHTGEEGRAYAALVTLTGSGFQLAYDDSQPSLITYGRPAVSGSSIFFLPFDFVAQSANGAGLDSTEMALSFSVQALAGVAISGFRFIDRGDYRLIGEQSSVSVFSEAVVSDGTTTSTLVVPVGPLSVRDGLLRPWMGSVEAPAPGHSPLSDPPDLVDVTLRKSLSAFTAEGQIGSLAFVQSKFGGARIDLSLVPAEVIPVPLPAGNRLLLAGLFVLGRLGGRLTRGQETERRGPFPAGPMVTMRR